jgi:segregation and condensation protein B
MTPQELQAALEAIIYAADEPVTIDQIVKAVGGEKTEVRAALDLLVAAYGTDDRGIEIRKVAGGWKFYTKPQQHDVVRRFIKSLRPPVRLTMPALETLAVIAYKQPATAPEINDIRGVNCGGVLKTLLEKRLITTAGRKEVIGRPILYRTSKDFLMRFGLSDLEELPSLKEFEQLAQAALGSDDGIAPIEPEETAIAAAPREPVTHAGVSPGGETDVQASANAPTTGEPGDGADATLTSEEENAEAAAPVDLAAEVSAEIGGFERTAEIEVVSTSEEPRASAAAAAAGTSSSNASIANTSTADGPNPEAVNADAKSGEESTAEFSGE